MTAANATRLDQVFDRLQAYPQRDILLDDSFREWIVSADDDALNRINAHTLATLWNVEVHPVLVWLIYASQVGLFDLNWEAHCTHCDGLSNITGRLGTIGHESSCKMCQVDFAIHSDENVEVTFSINPAIRPTQPSLLVSMPEGVVQLGKWDTSQPITLNMDKAGQYFFAHIPPGGDMVATRFDVRPGQPPLESLAVTFFPEAASPAQSELGPSTARITITGVPEVFGIYRDDTQPLRP